MTGRNQTARDVEEEVVSISYCRLAMATSEWCVEHAGSWSGLAFSVSWWMKLGWQKILESQMHDQSQMIALMPDEGWSTSGD